MPSTELSFSSSLPLPRKALCLALTLGLGLPALAGASSDLFLKTLIDDREIEPYRVQLADIDGDNDLDAVVATEQLIGGSGDDPVISWWRNDGYSVWVENTISSLPVNIHSTVEALQIGDFDGDGDPDVLAGIWGNDSIYWWENSGDGSSWTQHFFTNTIVRPAHLVPADLDGDGDLDFVHSGFNDNNLNGELLWWENTSGDATAWARNVIEPNGLGTLGGTGLSVGDLDGDGHLDIAAAFPNFFAWWENNGGASSFTRQDLGSSTRPTNSLILDVDGDSDLDIIANDSGVGMLWWRNNGSASSFTELTIGPGFGETLAVGDFDGDNDLDVAGNSANDLVWYENDGTGLSWTQDVIDAGFDAWAVASGDIDADGDIDLAGVFEGSEDEFAVWSNTSLSAPANFGTQNTVDNGLNQQFSVNVADIDADGSLDFLTASTKGNRVFWIESDGTRHLVDNTLAVVTVVAGDLDHDGDEDLVGAASNAGQVVWWQNTSGDGSTWTRQTIATGFAGAWSVAVADVDGDGDLDVAGAASNDDEIAWFENGGGGASWTEHNVETGFTRALTVGAADIDNDGDMDLIAGANIGNEIAWFENTGSGLSWTTHTVDSAFTGASSVVAADLDCDGDLDLVGSAFTAAEVSWWENTGSGLGWVKHFVSTATGVTAVIAADFDGNGTPDLAAGMLSGQDVIYLENTVGDGSSWLQTTVQTGFGAVDVVAGDIDGNGSLDLVGGSRRAIAWWSNTP